MSGPLEREYVTTINPGDSFVIYVNPGTSTDTRCITFETLWSNVNTSDGLDINPDEDGDVDVLTIGVTGSPRLWWDESADAFEVTKGLGVVNTLALSNEDEGGTGRLVRYAVREAVTLSGSTKATSLDIPSGAVLLGASMCVNTAVVDDDGDDTWSAAFSGGSETALASGAAAAAATKVDLLIVPEVTDDVTNVTFTPNGGDFTAGVIEIVVYYEALTSLASA